MQNSIPTIFNDVLGPVMRGPSSSHTAGSYRIGRLLRDLTGNQPKSAIFEFHTGGSLATTHQTQGSDLGLATGLAGLDILDPNMPDALAIAKNAGIDISFLVKDYAADHPNTYKCTLTDIFGNQYNAKAISTGGGMIKVISLMGFPTDIQGDENVLFAIFKDDSDCKARKSIEDIMINIPGYSNCEWVNDGFRNAVLYSFSEVPDIQSYNETFESFLQLFRILKPVMPVPGNSGAALPFSSLPELMQNADLMTLPASKLARLFEQARSGYTMEQLNGMMDNLIAIWQNSILVGLGGTSYPDRLVGSQSPGFTAKQKAGGLIEAGPLNTMIAYSTALMEVKSSMGVIVAAPTAGACGGLPGCLIGLADYQQDHSSLLDGFWAAGLVGLFIAMDATFAAEVAGCQAETGAGAAMAAAGGGECASVNC